MSQYDFGTIDAGTKSGAALAGDLNAFRDALNSAHKAAAAPSYAVAGTQWLDDASDPLWLLKVYDGTNWITTLAIDTVANVAYPVGVGPRQNFPLAGGTANALTLTPAVPFLAYADHDVVTFEAAASNTGAVTLNVSGAGEKSILKMVGGLAVPLAAGDLQAGDRYFLCYDSAGAGAWIVVNPSDLLPKSEVTSFMLNVLGQSNGLAAWAALGGAVNHATNGYIKSPTGTIIQWGTASIAGGSMSVNLPVTYPSAHRSVVVTPHAGLGAIALATVEALGLELFACRTYLGSTHALSTITVSFLSVGY